MSKILSFHAYLMGDFSFDHIAKINYLYRSQKAATEASIWAHSNSFDSVCSARVTLPSFTVGMEKFLLVSIKSPDLRVVLVAKVSVSMTARSPDISSHTKVSLVKFPLKRL